MSPALAGGFWTSLLSSAHPGQHQINPLKTTPQIFPLLLMRSLLKMKPPGGRREEGSGWGTHVYLWRIHFDIWQN